MNENGLEKLRSFVANMEEGERREVLAAWRDKTVDSLADVMAPAIFAMLNARLVGPPLSDGDWFKMQGKAWLTGSKMVLFDLLGLDPQTPLLDIEADTTLVLKRFTESQAE